MDNKFVFQYDQQEEEEETISLSNFPSTPDEREDDEYRKELSTFQDLRSPSDQTDLFEFFSDLNSNNMSHAEDIIFCGKLMIPFKEQYQSPPFIYQNTPKRPTPTHNKLQNFHRRRSESLSELKRSSPFNINTQIRMRNSRSLDDYQKLSRTSSMSSDSPEIHRNTSSARGSARFDGNVKITKHKWYFILFGNARFPPEMDLQDIKNRQVRRTPFQSVEVGKKGKSYWGVIKVLSCRDDASVHVARC